MKRFTSWLFQRPHADLQVLALGVGFAWGVLLLDGFFLLCSGASLLFFSETPVWYDVLILWLPVIGMIPIGVWIGLKLTRASWLLGIIPPGISESFFLIRRVVSGDPLEKGHWLFLLLLTASGFAGSILGHLCHKVRAAREPTET